MVRLEIGQSASAGGVVPTFTFQYGQIRNICYYNSIFNCYKIYIPVWLDQKYTKKKK